MTSTTNRVRRTAWSVGATMALGAGLLAATPGTSVAAAPDRAAVSDRSTQPLDLGTSSAVAPVQLPGQKVARSYTTREIAAFDRIGGDPAVLSYWTDARMKAAKPLDMPRDAKVVKQSARAVAQKLPQSTTRSVGSSVAPVAGKLAATPVTNYSITNGKLFIGGYQSGSWCSASAINTASKRLLITAGHCVHSGRGGTWRSNLVFVPRYNAFNADRDPVGRFQAYRLRTFNSWMNDSDLNRDVGFVTTYSGGDYGRRVVDTVGGHGIAYNGGTSFDVSIFGYPSNRSGGNAMSACWGTTSDSSWFDNLSKIGCNFGPGSSGGPWLWNYSNSTGQGLVRSVMSTIDGSGVNRGPYFDTAVYNAMNAANGDW